MKSILFQCTSEDVSYLPLLKPVLQGRCNFWINSISPDAVYEVIMRAKEKGATCVATTSDRLLNLLLRPDKPVSIDDYAGSIIERNGIEFLILHPLKHLVTVSYGRFLYERYLNKFLRPEEYLPIPQFTWELFHPSRSNTLRELLSSATFISCDIETATGELADLRAITCIGFTAIHLDVARKHYTATTVVVPFTDSYNITFAKTICRLPVLKIFQNGKYDNAYLLRYSLGVTNWGGDTQHLFHSWYSELPKDLGSLVAFLLRKWEFHKNESKTSDQMQYYEYNAKDAFTTAMCWLALMLEVPEYAVSNYLVEFPLVFPCLLAEMQGIAVDVEQMRKLRQQLTAAMDTRLKKLRVMVANPHYNPSSPQQTVRLFEMLGSGDIKSSGTSKRDKVKSRHPLNKRIVSDIENYRKDRKLETSYVQEDKLWHGRIYFALNPHGTDTGRLASKESAFWCGLQIQNIPRDRPDIQIKSMFVADAGFLFGECDYEQAEARDTAYLSGDPKLIEAVDDSTKDFHGKNASEFFGIPYEQIVNSYISNETGEWKHSTIDKAIRDLSKRTNHGANYNMGPQVMLDTMGIENVLKAKKLLRLPAHWSLIKVTEYLLSKYSETYPVVKGDYYKKIISDVTGSGFLVGPTGWTRRCFGDPTKSKHVLNSYVAHPSQSLNAMTLNIAYRKVFHDIALPNIGNFKLGPQIHDSILFQYRVGYEHLAWAVKDAMEFDVTVTDTYSKTRILRVPVALKGGSRIWAEVKDLKRPQPLTQPQMLEAAKFRAMV